ncbi:MAG: hypothetical protein FWC34_09855 [Bacteroidetes bacterium]|nr:hypothetical protein [Bacteroidota bacterium]MCL2301878.1 hypothetical protein [Lentimicrobiaceae bacterium]
MKNYRILIAQRVFDEDFKNISDFVSNIHTKKTAQAYVKRILEEIEMLSYLAEFIPTTSYVNILELHPQAKRIITKNGKWTVIFYVEDEFVKVIKITPSKMIKE